MAISKSHPMRFTPRGVVDAFDATDKFPGACQQLANLVFDSSNPELVVSRPGVVQITSFFAAGFSSPTFISVQIGIGTRIYGMIATARNAGQDEPFCFDTATGLFVTISGITGANTPISPLTYGDWTPPTMATVGTMIIVTHPGFSGAAGVFYGVFDVTNPAAPAWRSENTTTNLLPIVPTAVANFNNRAWFALGNQVYYTDVLTNPLTITNASQALTIGDSSSIVALSGLPVQTSSSGIVGTLTVFKQTQCWQIGGDTSTANLSLSYISLTIGTTAPRSVAQSPYGLYFISTGGPYFIDPIGALRALTHSLQETEPDLQTPFQNAVTPSRWAAAYNSSVYRICGPTVINGRNTINDYWFDEHKRRWNGPHSYAYDCASAVSGFFVLSSQGNPGILAQSFPQQYIGMTLSDLGAALQASLQSSSFPKVGDMDMKQVSESQIELKATGDSVIYTITAQDEQGATLNQAIVGVSPYGKVWGQFFWGSFTWAQANLWGSGQLWGSPPVGSGSIWGNGAVSIPHTYPVPWSAPLVFEKMQLLITAPAAANLGIGTFYARYQKTGYMTTGWT